MLKSALQDVDWQIAQKKCQAVLAEKNEIFFMFRLSSAIEGHGRPEKSALSPDGELRTVASG